MTVNIPPELLPPTINANRLAPIIGMSTSSIYQAIKENKFPFPVLRVGGRIMIPTAPIREALGFTETTAA